MISPISFKGTYQLYPDDKQISACGKFKNALEQDGQAVRYDFSSEAYRHSATPVTCVVSDSYNKVVENFCKSNGISFQRVDKEGFMSPEMIEKRIVPPETDKNRGVFIAKLNPEKLEKLMKNQTTNIDHCKSDYENYYKKETDFMIKSGKPIPATSFNVTSVMAGDQDAAIKYAERYGDNFNENSLVLDFSKRTDDPDHCVFFALKDLGFKEIPVCVNKSTFELGQKIGLLSN